jgi:hypothetical protein
MKSKIVFGLMFLAVVAFAPLYAVSLSPHPRPLSILERGESHLERGEMQGGEGELPTFDFQLPEDGGGIGFTTFAGLVALISLVVTQASKVLTVVSENRAVKIAVSVGTGLILTLVAWRLRFAGYLIDLSLWQALLQGVLAGLSACGLYDLFKPLFQRE